MKKFFVGIIIIFSLINIWSYDVPVLKKRVTDYTHTLNSSQIMELNRLLDGVEETTSSQVNLLIINSLEGEALEDYSMKVAEKNKIGQKEYDNGVLLLVSISDRKVRIEVGYGLESILTDIKCGYIIRKIIIPYFKQGDYYSGTKAGLVAISGLINNEFEISAEELQKFQKQSGKTGRIPPGAIMFIVFFIIMILKSIFRAGGRGRRGSLLSAILLGSMISSSSRRHDSFFDGGGFSSGGFSGGGGSFGGGGASGGW